MGERPHGYSPHIQSFSVQRISRGKQYLWNLELHPEINQIVSHSIRDARLCLRHRLESISHIELSDTDPSVFTIVASNVAYTYQSEDSASAILESILAMGDIPICNSEGMSPGRRTAQPPTDRSPAEARIDFRLEARDKLAAAERHINAQDQRIMELETAIGDSEADLTAAHEFVDGLKAELATVSEVATKAQQDSAKLTEKLRKSESRVADLEAEARRASTRASDQEAKLKETEQTASELQARAVRAETLAGSLQERADAAELKLSALEAQLQSVREEAAADAAEQREQVAELQAKLGQTKAKLGAKLVAATADLESTAASLREAQAQLVRPPMVDMWTEPPPGPAPVEWVDGAAQTDSSDVVEHYEATVRTLTAQLEQAQAHAADTDAENHRLRDLFSASDRQGPAAPVTPIETPVPPEPAQEARGTWTPLTMAKPSTPRHAPPAGNREPVLLPDMAVGRGGIIKLDPAGTSESMMALLLTGDGDKGLCKWGVEKGHLMLWNFKQQNVPGVKLAVLDYASIDVAMGVALKVRGIHESGEVTVLLEGVPVRRLATILEAASVPQV
ncbi:Chromosome partition protein Smc [Carpediemonas membranifera]|uniref:Chromosome partition protein Smc n=1 Tax=Carpediemonas membranifera TaxID=201153 RepID=A0A8J6E168_9EUKA|nr:Chromosome partition protein Smc [Carpediemonas membranifera]|eukprot:KAG9390247.1 Chromosome partition protein Smc [Carpediemonas membranifera]